ncbi:hypothetical protein [Pseudomonas sp.]|uniref:hypothetical protein n=1 Tax=Pseudomonas sp. TaxID=306 RepID=UPI003C33041D
MRRLIIGIPLALLLSGCSLVEGYTTLMNFGDHPIAVKAAEGRTAKKQDFLAIQKPKLITPIRNNGAQCFEYEMEKNGKKKDFYVGFTDVDTLSAYGWTTCADAIKSGYVK